MLLLNFPILIMWWNYNVLDILDSVRYIIRINLTFYILTWLLKRLKLCGSHWTALFWRRFLLVSVIFGIRPRLICSPCLRNEPVNTAFLCWYCFDGSHKCVKVAYQQVTAKLSKIYVLNTKILPVYLEDKTCVRFSQSWVVHALNPLM